MSISAEIKGSVYGLIPLDQYDEALENSGKTAEEFNAEIEQKICDTWDKMIADDSIYAYDSQSNYVSLDSMEFNFVREDDDMAIEVKVEGTETPEYSLYTKTRYEPDDPYSTIDRCPEEREVTSMAESVIDNALKDMGFVGCEVDTDDYDVIDWDELLYEEEQRCNDYFEEY